MAFLPINPLEDDGREIVGVGLADAEVDDAVPRGGRVKVKEGLLEVDKAVGATMAGELDASKNAGRLEDVGAEDFDAKNLGVPGTGAFGAGDLAVSKRGAGDLGVKVG